MANENSGKKQGDDLSGVLVMGLVGLLLLAFFALPAILAFIAFVILRDRLSKREFAFVAVVGAAAAVLLTASSLVEYGQWVWNATYNRHLTFEHFPVLFTISVAALFTGVLGMFSTSRIAQRLPWGFKSQGRPDRESILPSEQQKAKVSSIVSAPGSLAVPVEVNDIVTASGGGDRGFPIGMDANGQQVILTESMIRTHGMILGATGSGKTEAIKVVAGGLLDLGWSGMILDLKEDVAPGGLRDWCSVYAQHHGMPFQELRLSNSDSETWFNPLAGMGPDEIRDTILALQDFDDAYWQALNKELLGQMVNLLVWANQADPQQFPAPSMYDLGKLLAQGDLKTATKRHRAAVLEAIPGVTREDFRALENPSTAMQQSATGYGSKLTQFYDTQAGRTVLKPGLNNERRLIDVTQEGLTYVGLDSQGKADLTKVISSAMLQRMSVYAAARITSSETSGKPRPRFLIVDEANWVNRTIVQSLLSRARSAGIAMILCTQGPKDWIDDKGDDWGKLTQNVNVAVIMSQGEPESAKLCADYIGQVYKKQSSEMVRESRGLMWNKLARNNEGEIVESYSVKEELSHLVDPDDLRRMGVGEAILRVGKPSELVTWVRMPMRDPRQQARRDS